MTECEYIELLESQWPSSKRASASIIQLAREATRAHSNSYRLRCMLADLLQLDGDIGSHAHDQEIINLYQSAMLLDESDFTAAESLGFFSDALLEDFDLAERCFRQAILLGAGGDSYAGLARVLAQQGRRAEALLLLHQDTCPVWSESSVAKMRMEIARGDWTPLE